jgi:hypothetical protein
MVPTMEPLGRTFGGVPPHRTGKVRTIDQGEHLRKATGDGYHTAPPACGWHGAETPWMGGEHHPILLTRRRYFKKLFWTSVLSTLFIPQKQYRLIRRIYAGTSLSSRIFWLPFLALLLLHSLIKSTKELYWSANVSIAHHQGPSVRFKLQLHAKRGLNLYY